MDQQQWRRVGPFAPLMDEMNAYPINVRLKVSKRIERCLVFASVIAMQPVVGDILHIHQTDSVCPARPLGFIGPASAG